MHIQWDDASVLVTGGAGFIGSHLSEELVNRGADVIIADNFSRGRLENIEHLENDIEIRLVDLTTHRGCLRATENVDHVFHLSANVGGIHYIQRENIEALTPNVLMDQNMLEAARINGVDRFVYASSACIYRQEHDDLNLFSEVQAIPANPHSTYGWAKILGEIACEAYHSDTDLTTTPVRIFNSFGPRESLAPEDSHVIPSLCRKVIQAPDGGSIELFGDGSQERGFTYVTDVAEGMIRSMEVINDGQPINVGNSKEVVSMSELAEMIIGLSDKDLAVEHDLSKPTGTDKYACDMSRMTERLDWEPQVSLEDGLGKVYDWATDELKQESQSAVPEGGSK